MGETKTKSKERLSLYQAAMGPDFYKMPTVFQKMHGAERPFLATGTMEIVYGKSILAKFCTPFMPIPPKGSYPLELEIAADKKGERWTRTFPQHKMVSLQYIHRGKMHEQFGLSHFAFDLQLSDTTLRFNCLGQYFGFLPLPRFLSIKPDAIATAIDNKSWEMKVSIRLWGILLAEYKGIMRVVEV